MSKLKPIIFSTDDVRAILDGRKTQTRRAIKPQYAETNMDDKIPLDEFIVDVVLGAMSTCAPYKPDDILWVRETWSKLLDEYMFKADGFVDDGSLKWRPSIHMPREAARILLRVTGMRVEQLQDINEDDARREGVKSYFLHKEHGSEWKNSNNAPFWGVKDTFLCRVSAFEQIWDSYNAKRGYGWDTNPWVFVYDFEVISKEEAENAG